MPVFEALTEYAGDPQPALFLAGGISGCPGWQDEVVSALAELPVAVLNPRRKKWPDDPAEIERQIAWEYRHLRAADAIFFWFPEETLCPIALFELGSMAVYRDERGPRRLIVGTHPRYQRKLDVTVQLKLARPGLAVFAHLGEMIVELRKWLGEQSSR